MSPIRRAVPQEKPTPSAQKSAERGAKKVVVTDNDEKVLTVENPKKLAGHEGHHVAVTGKVTGDSIHVDSVKML